MQVKLSPISNPIKSFTVSLGEKVRYYDKVLFTEEERNSTQLKDKDWIVFLGKTYSVELLDRKPKADLS